MDAAAFRVKLGKPGPGGLDWTEGQILFDLSRVMPLSRLNYSPPTPHNGALLLAHMFTIFYPEYGRTCDHSFWAVLLVSIEKQFAQSESTFVLSLFLTPNSPKVK